MEDRKRNNLALLFIGLFVVITLVAVMGYVILGNEKELVQGQVEITEYRVSSKIPGRISEFRVSQGDIVKKGDTLAILDAPDIIAKQEQANAAKKAAEAQNKKAIKGARKQEIQMAYEMWQKARAALNVYEKSYSRIKNLNDEGVVADQKLDEVLAKRDAAIATEKAAHAQYNMALEGAEKETKETAEALVARAQGAVSEVDSYVNEKYLIASHAGEVNEIFPQLGELVGSGSPIMNICMQNQVKVLFNVREDLLHSMKVGQEIEAFLPAMDNEKIKVKVSHIKALGSYATWKATKTKGDYDLRTFEVKAIPEGKIDDLKAGMTVIFETKKN